MKPGFVNLAGQGWPCVSACVAVIRLRADSGFAVGVQASFRRGGTGRVWPSLRKARRRAHFLAALHRLPIVEAI